MNIDYLEVSAFTIVPGRGNAAGVCEFAQWPDDDTLSRIARAVALPVTSFIVRRSDRLELRWLTRAGTPVRSMCGHGTLAASFAESLVRPDALEFAFETPGGRVPVHRSSDRYHLALPRWNSKPLRAWPALAEALGGSPVEVLDGGRDAIAVYASEQEVRALTPDMTKLIALGQRGFVATAPGAGYDCVSRFFCPSFGIGVDEDPVTGSAHCAIAPYWAARLGKKTLNAFQASAAGGELTCEVREHSVVIGASAVLRARCSMTLP